MAATWWSRRLVTLLDSYGLGARISAAAATPAKVSSSFDVQPGLLVAEVQG